jgi:hypothetical protein
LIKKSKRLEFYSKGKYESIKVENNKWYTIIKDIRANKKWI